MGGFLDLVILVYQTLYSALKIASVPITNDTAL